MSRMSQASPKSAFHIHSYGSFVMELEKNQAFEKIEDFDFDIFAFE